MKKKTLKQFAVGLSMAAAIVCGIPGIYADAKENDISKTPVSDVVLQKMNVFNDGEESVSPMKSIYDNLLKEGSDYNETKKSLSEYNSINLSEELDGDTIRITAQSSADSEEGAKEPEVLTYTLNDKYIENSYSSLTGYSLSSSMYHAVSDYLEMDYELVNGYMSAVIKKNIKSDYYSMTADKAAGTISQKIYVAGQYDLSVIDNLYY